MKNWHDLWMQEQVERRSFDANTLCTYGIKILDDSLKCIMNNDLIIIGADSGIGKSELAITIAMTNVMNGKRVGMYYLEGGEIEAIARIKWREICKVYYSKYKGQIQNFDYVNWRTNNIKEKLLKEIEDIVIDKLYPQIGENLWIYPIEKGFTIEMLEGSLLAFHSLVPAPTGSPFEAVGQIGLDLLIIDHLQYFDLTGKENEIVQTTKILKRIKELTDIYHIPVVAMSHLRKKTKDRGLPDQEDFYGSSNIPKIASTAITITPDNSKEDFSDNLYPTFFRVVKSRIGIRPNYCMKSDFDLNKREYSSDYDMFLINNDGFVAKNPLPNEKLPVWAHKQQSNEEQVEWEK